MTYIIAGRLEECTFMMADSIVTNVETNQETMIHKIFKLDSSDEIFYSFTGAQFIDNCLRTYDFWLKNTNRKNDFITGQNSMKQLQEVIKQTLKSFKDFQKMTLGLNRLFFIDRSNVVYYDIRFDESNQLIDDAQKHELKCNEFIDSSILSEVKEGIPDMDVKEFCKKYLDDYLSPKSVDFKDRFSFVNLPKNGIITFEEPFKYFSDLIAMYNNVDFSNLDDDDFKWTF